MDWTETERRKKRLILRISFDGFTFGKLSFCLFIDNQTFSFLFNRFSNPQSSRAELSLAEAFSYIKYEALL